MACGRENASRKFSTVLQQYLCDCRSSKFADWQPLAAVAAVLLLLLRPPGVAADLALTARVVQGPEAQRLGLVSACHDTQDSLMAAVLQVAAGIAAKSPLAVAGTKAVLLHTR
jgi:enoyl-CoA hydratase/carnithine racemase